MAQLPSETTQSVSLQNQFPQHAALQLIPEAMARKHTSIPIAINDGSLKVAMANPTDVFALEALEARSKMRIEPVAASKKEIEESIDFNYRAYDEIERQISHISLPNETTENLIKLDNVKDAPVAQALSLIIEEAVKARTSDIHLQHHEDRLRVRYRIDGTLHDMLFLPLKASTPLISLIKILSNMNIADHHRQQDGQFQNS